VSCEDSDNPENEPQEARKVMTPIERDSSLDSIKIIPLPDLKTPSSPSGFLPGRDSMEALDISSNYEIEDTLAELLADINSNYNARLLLGTEDNFIIEAFDDEGFVGAAYNLDMSEFLDFGVIAKLNWIISDQNIGVAQLRIDWESGISQDVKNGGFQLAQKGVLVVDIQNQKVLLEFVHDVVSIDYAEQGYRSNCHYQYDYDLTGPNCHLKELVFNQDSNQCFVPTYVIGRYTYSQKAHRFQIK
jgi:hypothetical protein